MTRKVTVMVRTGSLKRSIENFGNNRYLIKTDKIENMEVNQDILFMLSKTLGLPVDRIVLVAGETSDNKIFQLI